MKRVFVGTTLFVDIPDEFDKLFDGLDGSFFVKLSQHGLRHAINEYNLEDKFKNHEDKFDKIEQSIKCLLIDE